MLKKYDDLPNILKNKETKKYYDILILYDRFDPMQIQRFSDLVPIMKNTPDKTICCDTIILNRLTDKIPPNVIYKKSVQMCHACVQKNYTINLDRDYLVNVSQVSKDSWGSASDKGTVIHNMSYPEANELMLVSATRMGAVDKGSNDNRIRTLANMLNDNNIPFVWLNFSDKALNNPPRNFINMGPRVNIHNFIKRADYLVQLSDVEAYSMSVLEALTLNTPVIATPFPSLFEEGFEDGVNGYVVPFDMDFDIKKLLKIPKFKFKYDNASIIDQWKGILDAPAPHRTFEVNRIDNDDEKMNVRVIRSFKDKYTGRFVPKGYATFTRQRVMEILEFQKIQKVRLIEVSVN